MIPIKTIYTKPVIRVDELEREDILLSSGTESTEQLPQKSLLSDMFQIGYGEDD